MTEALDPLSMRLRGSRLIEASAGTGKTWTIAALYLRLVLGHGGEASAFPTPLAPQRILVMTFTKAATRELSARIRARLVEAARRFRGAPGDDAFIDALLASYPEGPVREMAAWRLATAAEAMDDGAVYTIDAWIQRMLREHAFDSGSPFDETLQIEDDLILVEAAHDCWRREVYPLTGAAFDAVRAVWPDAFAFVDDMRRLMRYAALDDRNDDVLETVWRRSRDTRHAAVTGLKVGWAERAGAMRGWLLAGIASKQKPFNGSKMQAGRVNGWFDAIDRWATSPDALELSLSDGARKRLVRAGVEDALRLPLAIPSDFDAFAVLLEELAAFEDSSHVLRRHAASRVAMRMRLLKQRSRVYSFDDLLERLDRALDGPNGERLRDRIVEQYPVAMIDEFQDTSPLQYRIFDRLYRIADDDPDAALLLIGDPKQSIYRFRGADIDSYLRARRATHGRHELLTTNHRSATGVVAAINHLFAQAEPHADGAFRFGAPRPDSDDSPLPFFPVAARGRDEVLHARGGPLAAMTICHDTRPASSGDILDRFAERCAEDIAITLNDPACGFVDADGTSRRVRPADLTVLVRTGKEAAAVRRALRHRGIQSVYVSDQDSVFASQEAKDLLHWLRAVADPRDARRARIAFATHFADLSTDRMAQLGHDDRAFEARMQDLERLDIAWRRQGVLPMLRRSLHLLDLPARWLARGDGERRLTNVLHLAELLQSASSKLDGEQALIRWLGQQLEQVGDRAEEQMVRLESDADLVKVVTIHTAKGLEYPIVYLPFATGFHKDLWEDLAVVTMPDDAGRRGLVLEVTDDVKEHVERETRREELRLLYVALTRARHALWIGVGARKEGKDGCAFHRSALGYLISHGTEITASAIATRLHEVFDAVPSVRLVEMPDETDVTRPALETADTPLRDAPVYAAGFERDWSIGSFSSLVRDLARMPLGAIPVDPSVEEELLAGPVEADVRVPSNAARHRFPRGASPGNFLHDQLEWLAAQRFALNDPAVREQLSRRCERQGWGSRSGDVVTWMGEVVETPLPPIGTSLRGLARLLPEMEFWFPSEGADARRIDGLCRRHLFAGRERPTLPERTLTGMLMGFADLVFEVDGRYWVLDYKSNALGAADGDYTRDALERSMVEHRYDVQAAVYLLALHRLLRSRLGDDYDPARQLGGALYLYLRGIRGPEAGCCVVAAVPSLLDALDDALRADAEMAP